VTAAGENLNLNRVLRLLVRADAGRPAADRHSPGSVPARVSESASNLNSKSRHCPPPARPGRVTPSRMGAALTRPGGAACPLWGFRPTTDYRASESGPDRAVGRTVNGNVEDRTVNGVLSVTRLSTIRSRIRTL
jgi:hypothetical protein